MIISESEHISTLLIELSYFDVVGEIVKELMTKGYPVIEIRGIRYTDDNLLGEKEGRASPA